jgi:hypothetical protein
MFLKLSCHLLRGSLDYSDFSQSSVNDRSSNSGIINMFQVGFFHIILNNKTIFTMDFSLKIRFVCTSIFVILCTWKLKRRLHLSGLFFSWHNCTYIQYEPLDLSPLKK